MESLKSLFRCYICMEKVKNARLCPHCSKLCCLHCIRCWIIDQHHSFCPHCRMPMTLMKFINCRWAEEATQQLTTLQVAVDSISQNLSPPDTTMCNIHKEKLSVYCNTCDDVICHECALWDKRHSGHNFQPLDEVYRKHISHIESQITKLKIKLLDIFTYIKVVDNNMEDIKMAKDEGVKELTNALEHMINRLDLSMKQRMCSLEFVKRQMHYEMDRLETFLQKIGSELGALSKADTIKRSSQIVEAFEQLLLTRGETASILTQRIDLTKFTDNHLISASFPSEIVPPFDTAVFVIEDFPKARFKAEPIYSDPLKVFGLVWRLKIYPDGNGAVRGQYLSVFLELTSCVYGSHSHHKSTSHIEDRQNGERNQEVRVTDASEQNKSTAFDSRGVDSLSFCKDQALAPSKYEYRVEMINQKRSNIDLPDKIYRDVQQHVEKRSLRLNKTQYHQHFPSASHSFLPTVDDGLNVNDYKNVRPNLLGTNVEGDASANYQNPKEVKRNIVREFASDFEVGECWGYNRFFRLALLESEGFLADGRTLELKFSVRPPTFYQACRDRDRYIRHLEKQLDNYPDSEFNSPEAIDLNGPSNENTAFTCQSGNELELQNPSAYEISKMPSKNNRNIEVGGVTGTMNERSCCFCDMGKASTSNIANVENNINPMLISKDATVVKVNSVSEGKNYYKLEFDLKPYLMPLLLDLDFDLFSHNTLYRPLFSAHNLKTLSISNDKLNKVIQDIFESYSKLDFCNQTISRKDNTTECDSHSNECNPFATLQLPKRPTISALMEMDEKSIQEFFSLLCRHFSAKIDP